MSKKRIVVTITPKRPVISKAVMVVYGFDENGMPRAAKFAAPDFELARKAADLMCLQVFEGEARKIARAIRSLPSGQVYASGWGFVPNVGKNLFDGFLRAIGVAETGISKPLPYSNLPVSWSAIKVGDLVLGQADSAEDGYWPAIVVEHIKGDMLTLQARDFPKAPKVIRHRSAVALFFNPDYQPPTKESIAAPGLPVSWDLLAVDHLVIAGEPKAEDGFGEGIIIAIDANTLTLKWRDYPRLPQFKRHRHSVALLNPAAPTKP